MFINVLMWNSRIDKANVIVLEIRIVVVPLVGGERRTEKYREHVNGY